MPRPPTRGAAAAAAAAARPRVPVAAPKLIFGLSPKSAAHVGAQLARREGTGDLKAAAAAVTDAEGYWSVQDVNNALKVVRKRSHTDDAAPLLRRMAAVLKGNKFGVLSDLANILYSVAGMADEAVDGILGEVARLAGRQHADATFRGKTLGIALYGLRRRTTDTPAVRELLAAVTRCVSQVPSLSTHEVMMCMSGMAGLGGSPAADPLLSAVAGLAESARGDVSGMQVGAALYGLSRSTDPLDCLAKLVPVFSRVSGRITGGDVCAGLYGTRKLPDRKSTREVIGILAGMAAEVEGCELPAVRMAAQGLHARQGPEARLCLGQLARLLRGHRPGFHDVADIVFPLWAHADSTETRGLLRVIRPMLAEAEGPVAAADVAKLASGLRLQSTGSVALNDVLVVLTQRVAESDQFTWVDASHALSSFAFRSATPAAERLCGALAGHVERVPVGEVLQQEVTQAVVGVANLGSSPTVERMLKALLPHLKSCQMLDVDHVHQMQVAMGELLPTPAVAAVRAELAKAEEKGQGPLPGPAVFVRGDY